jgi:ABC-type sugar transport system substrate-binding protein
MRATSDRLVRVAVLLLTVLLPVAGGAREKQRIVAIPKGVGISSYGAMKEGVDAAARRLSQRAVVWIRPTQDFVEEKIKRIEAIISKPFMMQSDGYRRASIS